MTSETSTARSAQPAASIRDVARVAGVSHMTVSRVLNAPDSVRAATRARVMAAIESLNFRPSRTAQALANGRAKLLGVLDATAGMLYGPASTINAIGLAVREVGYSVTVAGLGPSDATGIHDALQHLIDEQVAGLIIIGPGVQTREALAALNPTVPVVTLHGSQDVVLFTEQASAARAAVAHLIGLGHRKIAHIAGPADWSEAVSRQRGFGAELRDSGLTPAAIEASDWSAASGYHAARRLLSRADFTAVFCANDQIALGMLHAAAEAGRAVPRDLSVVGFDDTPESAYYSPALTTLRQDFTESGRRAVAAILAAFGEGPGVPAQPAVPRLVVRESTAPVGG